MNINTHINGANKRPGSILMVVLIVVMVVSLGAYTFSAMMLAHNETALLSSNHQQARWLVDSGIDTIRVHLSLTESDRLESGGSYDNPVLFQAINIVPDPDPVAAGNFTVLSPAINSDGYTAGIRYGLENESARLNLNALLTADDYAENGGRTLLMALPGMTENEADAIMDWIDEDDEPREYGAEYDYYQGLSSPYTPTNGPFNTVEELLLVRGVSPQLLFGADVNRNGMVDAHEQAALSAVQQIADLTATAESAAENMVSGSLERGWSSYLTLYSQENNLNINGEARINFNEEDLTKLHQDLSAVFSVDVANFVILYRQGLPTAGSSDAIPIPAAAYQVDLTIASEKEITQILELIGLSLEGPPAVDGEDPIIIESPWPAVGFGSYIDHLMDNSSTNDNPTIPGRLNINAAPRTLLEGVPGLTSEAIDRIVQERFTDPTQDTSNYTRHETWLVKNLIVSLEEMKLLQPFITGNGDVYRAQIIGYYEGGKASSRAEVVIDSTTVTPRVRLWRDLSHLGRGYPLEVLGYQYRTGDTSMPSSNLQ
ncbi:MAG: general secretion pathway protein GspK [Pirellulaceae bacterium]|nr:general secretion pathway protein GspK [Pirellulaceae bacterium]